MSRISPDQNDRAPGVLKRRRGALLAGTFGLALLGVAAGGAIIPETIPVWAQTAPNQAQAQAAPQQAPAGQAQGRRDQNGNLITVERPANAPASFAPIVKQVEKAVVSVRVETDQPTARLSDFGEMLPDLPDDHPLNRWFRRFGEGAPDMRTPQRPERPGPQRRFSQAQGSGFFVSSDGYVVTNNHVVSRGQKVQIVTIDGTSYDARVVGVDDRTDIAVLKVDSDKEFPFVRFASSDPEVGDWTVAIGNPFGLGGTVTAGIVSARGRDIGASPYDDFIQIDAPINRGNSGGPAFNLNGEVIGINTAIFSPSGGSVGIGFAIPAEVASRVATELRESGEVTRGWLGVAIQPVTKDIADSLGLAEARGAIVSEPQAGAPAANAGIRPGDVIVSVNGQSVENPRDLARKVAELDPGTRAEVGLIRDGQQQTVRVELGRLPREQRQASASPDRPARSSSRMLEDLGLAVAPANSVAGAGDRGVVVTDVEANSPAAEKGLREGDVILDVGGTQVSNPDDVSRAIEDAERSNRRAVLFRVKSGDQTRFVALAVGGNRRG